MQIQKEKLIQLLKEQGFPNDILSAFSKVRREDFVPEQVLIYAYEDIALPLDDGSSLSQPSTLAFVLKLLEPKQNQKIFEIGSGSGYVLSLLSEIIRSGKIYGLEINPRLAIKSKLLLKRDSNIEIINRSGFEGMPENAPFDRILVSASCPDKTIANKLLSQLKDPGIMVVPIKQSIHQFTKRNGEVLDIEFPGFGFVPFVEK